MFFRIRGLLLSLGFTPSAAAPSASAAASSSGAESSARAPWSAPWCGCRAGSGGSVGGALATVGSPTTIGPAPCPQLQQQAPQPQSDLRQLSRPAQPLPPLKVMARVQLGSREKNSSGRPRPTSTVPMLSTFCTESSDAAKAAEPPQLRPRLLPRHPFHPAFSKK